MSIPAKPQFRVAKGAVHTVVSYLFNSFFRFLLILGIVLTLLGLVLADTVLAGHLGIYGLSALVVGTIGRLFWWMKD